ncbi:hypothetical protein L1987_10297 [Smallanthus sonchifolius]|uniref:Uncharacterized protein n=1 Tax=Smallanthus sonchifolius TaxID=185202 RepID=A0ACB9JRN0_9ASTR|nr:hypothetical protein L1987_10297 [Smallanthus sonchifolius]
MNVTTTSPIPIILRRSTITATTTTTATSSPSAHSSVDFELVSIKPTRYTSLRDILQSLATVVLSPKTPLSAANSGYEILIRDRLVKHAAWAYLQPMSTSHQPNGSTTFRRMWTQFSGTLLRLIATAFDCLLPSIRAWR